MSRKSEKLFDGITEIDADLIEETLDQTPQRRARPWMRAVALAACLGLIIGAGYGILSSFRMGTAAPGDGGGAGHDEGSTFMHYAGPVFPLTTAENANGITAERDITLDFAAYGAENYADSITVTDTYTLTNMTDADITLIAAYPTAGTLLENPEVELSADGEVVAVDFVPGAPLEAMFAESWADYAADLGGAYLADALSGAPELDETVTVYELKDITGGDADATAPTLCMSFELEGFSSSRLLTWGFNGGGLDREHGIVQVSFFIPEEGWWGYGMTRYVIVRGEDIGGYTIQGYADGGCYPGEEIAGVSASVRRYETTLGEILDVVEHESYPRQSDTGLPPVRRSGGALCRRAAPGRGSRARSNGHREPERDMLRRALFQPHVLPHIFAHHPRRGERHGHGELHAGRELRLLLLRQREHRRPRLRPHDAAGLHAELLAAERRDSQH